MESYLCTLGRISKKLDKEDVKGFLAWLERSKYKPWTGHNHPRLELSRYTLKYK